VKGTIRSGVLTMLAMVNRKNDQMDTTNNE